jgi:hypothetical protein
MLGSYSNQKIVIEEITVFFGECEAVKVADETEVDDDINGCNSDVQNSR